MLMSMASPATIASLVQHNTQAADKSKRSKEQSKNLTQRGRRELLLLSSSAAATSTLIMDSRTELLKRYLNKSEENKAKNEKERLDSYYKRNYRDYFGSLESSLRQKQTLTETEKEILKWLDSNK